MISFPNIIKPMIMGRAITKISLNEEFRSSFASFILSSAIYFEMEGRDTIPKLMPTNVKGRLISLFA